MHLFLGGEDALKRFAPWPLSSLLVGILCTINQSKIASYKERRKLMGKHIFGKEQGKTTDPEASPSHGGTGSPLDSASALDIIWDPSGDLGEAVGKPRADAHAFGKGDGRGLRHEEGRRRHDLSLVRALLFFFITVRRVGPLSSLRKPGQSKRLLATCDRIFNRVTSRSLFVWLVECGMLCKTPSQTQLRRRTPCSNLAAPR